MSLLEDVFLQDEANEAEQLERVIEGDEFEERRRSDSDENSEKEDEAEEDKRKVDPTKTKTVKVVKHPRFLLNPVRLTGPRGIQVIPEHFKDFKFKGKGHEKEDLDLVLKRLEHWAYRLYPKFQFEDCLKKIEMLGKKRPVAVQLHKIRSDQFLSEDTVVQKDSSDEDTPMPVQEEDEFDKLLQQQIELARSTPAPNSAKKPTRDGSISPKDKRTTSLMMPKATSSPSINDEQRERMLRSRRLAEERRLARLKNAVNTDNSTVSNNSTSINSPIENNLGNSESNIELSREINKDADNIAIGKKHNRSNVIDSSDEEDALEMSISTAVDVHTANKITEENGSVDNENPTHSIHGDSEAKRKENTISNSRLDVNEGNKLISDSDNDNVMLNDDMSEKTDKVHENEGLRNDDSDVIINLNEHIPDSVNEHIQNINEKEAEIEDKERSSNDTVISRGLVKESMNCEEITTENDLKISNELSNENIHPETDKTSVVPEEITDEIMDVDFSDDF